MRFSRQVLPCLAIGHGCELCIEINKSVFTFFRVLPSESSLPLEIVWIGRFPFEFAIEEPEADVGIARSRCWELGGERIELGGLLSGVSTSESLGDVTILSLSADMATARVPVQVIGSDRLHMRVVPRVIEASADVRGQKSCSVVWPPLQPLLLAADLRVFIDFLNPKACNVSNHIHIYSILIDYNKQTPDFLQNMDINIARRVFCRYLEDAKTLIERLSGHRIGNDQLLLEALDTSGLGVPQANKRLALLGDRSMGLIVVDIWYPTGTERKIAQEYIARLQNDNLAALARKVGLESCVIPNPGSVGALPTSTLATSMEAVMAAIYLDADKDLEPVRKAMNAMDMDLAPSR